MERKEIIGVRFGKSYYVVEGEMMNVLERVIYTLIVGYATGEEMNEMIQVETLPESVNRVIDFKNVKEKVGITNLFPACLDNDKRYPQWVTKNKTTTISPLEKDEFERQAFNWRVDITARRLGDIRDPTHCYRIKINSDELYLCLDKNHYMLHRIYLPFVKAYYGKEGIFGIFGAEKVPKDVLNYLLPTLKINYYAGEGIKEWFDEQKVSLRDVIKECVNEIPTFLWLASTFTGANLSEESKESLKRDMCNKPLDIDELPKEVDVLDAYSHPFLYRIESADDMQSFVDLSCEGNAAGKYVFDLESLKKLGWKTGIWYENVTASPKYALPGLAVLLAGWWQMDAVQRERMFGQMCQKHVEQRENLSFRYKVSEEHKLGTYLIELYHRALRFNDTGPRFEWIKAMDVHYDAKTMKFYNFRVYWRVVGISETTHKHWTFQSVTEFGNFLKENHKLKVLLFMPDETVLTPDAISTIMRGRELAVEKIPSVNVFRPHAFNKVYFYLWRGGKDE